MDIMLDEFKITINGFVNTQDGKFIDYENTMIENWFIFKITI